MPASSNDDVRKMYDEVAPSYGEMMDQEVLGPTYTKVLSLLAESIADVAGAVLDTSTGTGHLLERYRNEFDPERAIIALDLSPGMVEASKKRLGDVEVQLGDMRELSAHRDGSLAAVISLFAIHHLDPAALPGTFREWRRVLAPGGQLVVGAWEGEGEIDYGDAADLTAFLHPQAQLMESLRAAGFSPALIEEKMETEMGMNSVYLRGRASSS